jgi:hypothetical protein
VSGTTPSGAYKGALEDPATRRACERARRASRLTYGLSVVVVPGFGFVAGFVPPPMWTAVSASVVMVAILALSDSWRRRVRRYRRILEVYPWARYEGVAQVAQDGVPFVRLPHPDAPEKSVVVPVRRPGIRRWQRAMRANPGQEVWFAGDPRVGGVLALPGPRRFTLALQSGPAGAALRAEPGRGGGLVLRDMTDEALRRARAAGFSDAQYAGEPDGWLRARGSRR